MTFFKPAFVLFSALCANNVFAQTAENQTTGFEAAAPVFEPSSTLSYDRTNIKPEGNLTLGLWYSQAEALSVSFGIEQDKLFGTDENFRLRLEASSYSQTAQISVTDPDFFESAYSRQLSLSMYNIQPNRSQNGSYEFSGAETSIAFGRQLTDTFSFSFGAGLGKPRIKNDTSLPDFIRNYVTQEGESETKTFGFFNILFDETDGSYSPANGYRLGMANELGFVGSTTYIKTQIRGSYFAKATPRTGLKVHGDLSYGDVIGSGPFPIFENFYAGGPGSVRGYAQNTLGPTSAIPNQTNVAYSGGAFRVTGGVELSTRVGDRDDLHLLGFYDVGNVFNASGDFKGDALRSSVGIGVRWDSPVGPLNVYLSKPLNDAPTDKLEQLQFTLGARF